MFQKPPKKPNQKTCNFFLSFYINEQFFIQKKLSDGDSFINLIKHQRKTKYQKELLTKRKNGLKLGFYQRNINMNVKCAFTFITFMAF